MEAEMIQTNPLWRLRRKIHTFLRRISQRTNELSKKFAARAPVPSSVQVRDQQSFFVVTDQSGDSIAVPTFSRLSLYRAGVARRLDALSREYCLDPVFFDSPRVVVDVGANSGEFGVMTVRSGGEYFGFEPDPRVFPALQKNVPAGHLHQLAVGDQDAEATLYLATELADSSLFASGDTSESVTVSVRRLDSLLSSGSCCLTA
jgi:methyltransferase, FkbM family